MFNKANLRDLIAATGLIILLKLGSNCRFFSPCEIEIWRMTSKNCRAPLLYYIKFCASSARSIPVKIGDFLSRVTLKFDGWPWKIIGHLFYVDPSFVRHFITIGELKLKLQSRNAQFGSKSAIHCPVWPWNLTDDLKKNRALLLCCFMLYASSHSHRWIQTKVAVRKRSIRVKIGDFFVSCDLEIWRMTLKNNRAPLLRYIKLYASFYHHMWIQTGVTVRKQLSWLMTSVTLTFDLWPWPFALTSLLSLVITPDNFMMIRT